MASIAYVTDQRMIEYHRLNGNKTLNFWRPRNTKKFTDFKKGDILFFLVKGTERSDTREKGIMGYGYLVKTQTMSVHQMWNTYGTENGYDSEEELKEAIIKVSKRELPDKINSLYLDRVVFFQAPIYLSEIGVNVSNRLESYIYLDQKDASVTGKILNKAKETGVDMWSLVMNDEEETEMISDKDIIDQVESFIEKGMSSKDAIKEVSKVYQINKNKVYSLYHKKNN